MTPPSQNNSYVALLRAVQRMLADFRKEKVKASRIDGKLGWDNLPPGPFIPDAGDPNAGTVVPNGPAGGVLSGAYPAPGFAVDMATQAELDAHKNASPIDHPAGSVTPVKLSAGGTTPDATKSYRGDGTWQPVSGSGATRWVPLSNGDPSAPEIIFDALGQVMVVEETI